MYSRRYTHTAAGAVADGRRALETAGLFGSEPGGIFADRIIGAVSGYALFAGLGLAYRRLRGVDGLGLGDAKLLAAGGAWLGWTAIPFVVLAAAGALVFELIRTRGQASARTVVILGPWLAGAIWLGRLVQEGVLNVAY